MITLQIWHFAVVVGALLFHRLILAVLRSVVVFAVVVVASMVGVPLAPQDEAKERAQREKAMKQKDPMDEVDDKIRPQLYAIDMAQQLTTECLATGAEVEPIQPYDEWANEVKTRRALAASGG